MAHEASTAGASRAGGAPGRPKTTRAAVGTAHGADAQAGGPVGADVLVEAACPFGDVDLPARDAVSWPPPRDGRPSGLRATRVMRAGDGQVPGAQHREDRRGRAAARRRRGGCGAGWRHPRREVGTPYSEAARSVAGTPTRSAAPVTEPAEVPTMMAAARGSQPLSRCRAPPGHRPGRPGRRRRRHRARGRWTETSCS